MANDTPMSHSPTEVPRDPDALLVDLCAQWEALRVAWNVACEDFRVAEVAAVEKYRHLGMPALWAEVDRDPAYREAKRRTSKLVRRSHVLFDEIAQTRAVTLQGVMAKANVTLSECLEGIDAEMATNNDGIVPQFMALSLVRDLLRINGGQA